MKHLLRLLLLTAMASGLSSTSSAARSNECEWDFCGQDIGQCYTTAQVSCSPWSYGVTAQCIYDENGCYWYTECSFECYPM